MSIRRKHAPASTPRVSIIGIDGAGKSSVAREAQLGLSSEREGFTSLEIDRTVNVISQGTASHVESAALDKAAQQIDGHGSRLASRALYAREIARLGAHPETACTDQLSAVVNVRDPLVDSIVFASQKLPVPPKLGLYGLRAIYGTSWPDAVVWLDIGEDCAMERISGAAASREQLGEQSHERPEVLRAMRDCYGETTAALGSIAHTRIIRLDAERPLPDVAADVQTILDDFASPNPPNNVELSTY
jgi:hypothetical protein